MKFVDPITLVSIPQSRPFGPGDDGSDVIIEDSKNIIETQLGGDPPPPPPPPPGNEDGAFDEAKYISENFGAEYGTKEALKAVLDKSKQFSNVDPKYLSIAEKVAKNPNAESLIDYVTGGGRDVPFFWDLVNTDTTTLSNFQKILKVEILENKDESLTPKMIEAVLRKKYNMLENPEEELGKDYTEAEKNEGLYMASKDGASAELKIKDLQAKARLSEPQKAAIATQESETARLKTWEPELNKGFQKHSQAEKFKLGDVDLGVDFEWEPDAETSKAFNSLFADVVKNSQGTPCTPENVEKLRTFATKIFVGSIMPRIVRDAMHKTAMAMTKHFGVKYNGMPGDGKERNGDNNTGDDIQITTHQSGSRDPQYNW